MTEGSESFRKGPRALRGSEIVRTRSPALFEACTNVLLACVMSTCLFSSIFMKVPRLGATEGHGYENVIRQENAARHEIDANHSDSKAVNFSDFYRKSLS